MVSAFKQSKVEWEEKKEMGKSMKRDYIGSNWKKPLIIQQKQFSFSIDIKGNQVENKKKHLPFFNTLQQKESLVWW